MTKRLSKALVLAAGLGTRLRPLTDTTPKCLVPIGDRPLLDFWMSELSRAGVLSVMVNTHHLRAPVQSYLQQASANWRLDVAEFYEPKLLGSAGTVSANPAFADDADHCLIIYADNLSNLSLVDLLAFHDGHGAPMTMVLFHTDRPKACGIASMDDSGAIVEFVEKPENPVGNLANAGIYVVTRAAYQEMARMNGFDLGFDILPKFVGRMKGYVHKGCHLDVGTHDALESAQSLAQEAFGGQP